MTYSEAMIESKNNQQAVRRASWDSSNYVVYVPERVTAVTWIGWIKKFLGNLPITLGEHFLKATPLIPQESMIFNIYVPTDEDKNATDWELYTKKVCNDKTPDMSIPKTTFCEV